MHKKWGNYVLIKSLPLSQEKEKISNVLKNVYQFLFT